MEAIPRRRLRIVHALPELRKGGGERVAIDLANHAAEAGHEVCILASAPTDPALLPTEVDVRVTLRYVSEEAGTRFGRYRALLLWLHRSRDWILQQDIVHCHMTFGAVIGTGIQLLRLLSRGTSPAVVETYHGVGMTVPGHHRFIHALMAARRDALAIMAEDSYWRRVLDSRGTKPSAMIPNGIAFEERVRPRSDIEEYRRTRAAIPASARLVVGTVGRLAPERRPELYIPVFAQIAHALGPDVHFLLAGAGPELAKVEAAIDAFGLQTHVHLPGLALDPGLPMALMDLYITVNVGPLTGIAALEASFSGLPVIAIQMVEGYRSRPEDWIWSSGDLGAVAREATRLLLDRGARRALAERQQAFVRANHTVEGMASSYYSLYEEALLVRRRGASVGQGKDT